MRASATKVIEQEEEDQDEEDRSIHDLASGDGHKVAEFEYPSRSGDRRLFVLRFVPEFQCFSYYNTRPNDTFDTFVHTLSLIEHASLYRVASKRLRESWDKEGPTDSQNINMRIQRKEMHEGNSMSVSWAAGLLQDGVKQALAHARPRAIRLQRTAFSTFGEVPHWAYTAESIQNQARGQGWDDHEYAHKDFVRMRWYRLALATNRSSEKRSIRQKMKNSGRVRKAVNRAPGNISGQVFHGAIGHLDTTADPPERRLTWLALARAGTSYTVADEHQHTALHDVARALHRASDYELRKAKRIYFDHREHMTGERERWYTGSEYGANSFIDWLADAQRIDTDQHPWAEDLVPTARSSIVTWARNSARYHRELDYRAQVQRSRETLQEQPLAAGPTVENDLPDSLTQLRTAQQVVEEGERMSHCVSSYTDRVVEGRSLLFHYEQEGDGEESAGVTCQLNKKRSGDGWTIRQIRGQRNGRPQPTCREARELLEALIAEGIDLGPARIELGQYAAVRPRPRDIRPAGDYSLPLTENE